MDNMIASRKRAVGGEKKHTVSLTVEFDGNSFNLMPTDVWSDKGIADKWYAMLQQGIGTPIHATVIGVEDIVEHPISCFNLATLQSEAIAKLGMFPAKTNETAVSLFEKGYISSHKTSTSDLPERLRRQLTRRYPSAKQYDFVPDSRIPYCHGIIVTERTPMFLSEDETRLYNLIAERMEAALAAPRCYTEVAVEININGLSLFGAIEMPYGYQPDDDIIFVNPTGASILGFSKKKPGPLMADEFLKGIYEVIGINEQGRKLPLDGIHDMGMSLQRLIDNGFVKELLGELEVTQKGKVLINHTEKLELSDLGVLMAQIQEVDALADSLTGTAETMRNYEDWIYSQIRPLVANARMFANKPSSHKCPKCGGTLTNFPSVVTCDKCDFSIPKFFKGYELTHDDIRQLLTFGYTSPIYGFIGKRGCKFSQALVLDRKHGITFADRNAKIYS